MKKTDDPHDTWTVNSAHRQSAKRAITESLKRNNFNVVVDDREVVNAFLNEMIEALANQFAIVNWQQSIIHKQSGLKDD